MSTIRLTEDLNVIDEADLCVLGGSCTGVFAAVRAARLGLKVVLVEKQSHFGGMAPLTCTWHSLFDTAFKRQIIAGLTQETLDRLKRRGAMSVIEGSPSKGSEFRPGELKVVLDELVVESGVTPRLHTLFIRPLLEDGALTGVVVADKSGLGVIRARVFVDATGDGDLCSRLGLDEYRYPAMLPPTACAFLDRWPSPGLNVAPEVRKLGAKHNLPECFVWGTVLPGTDLFMLAGTRVTGADCSVAADLTRAEIEGRRQVRSIMDILAATHPGSGVVLFDFPSSIGIRDTRHVRCAYETTGDDILTGRRFPDAVVNGSYRVDIHHQDKPGVTFMHLDGSTAYHRPGLPSEYSRWRPETPESPTFYQLPLRSLIPPRIPNLVLAGRMLDADHVAFSALRVMVNTNQMGEAAGVAAFVSLDTSRPIQQIDPLKVRALLAQGGSIVI